MHLKEASEDYRIAKKKKKKKKKFFKKNPTLKI